MKILSGHPTTACHSAVAYLILLVLVAGSSHGYDHGVNTGVKSERNQSPESGSMEFDDVLAHIEGNVFTTKSESGGTYDFHLGSRPYRIHFALNDEGKFWSCGMSFDTAGSSEPHMYVDLRCDSSLEFIYVEGKRTVPTESEKNFYNRSVEEFKLVLPVSRRYQSSKKPREPGYFGRIGFVLSNGELLERIGDLIRATDLALISNEKYEFHYGNYEEQVNFIGYFENGTNTACAIVLNRGRKHFNRLYWDHDCNGSLDYIRTNNQQPVRVRDLNHVRLYEAMLMEAIMFLEVAVVVDPKE